MENNNFEKKIQEKLADLTIQPSEKAWRGIESRIGKKDSTKRILWFLLIGLFLLAGGGYLFLKDGKGNDKEIALAPKQNTETVIKKIETDHGISPGAVSDNGPILLNEEKQVHLQSTDKSNNVQPLSLESTSDAQHKSSIKEMGVKHPVESENVIVQVETRVADIIKEEPAKETNTLAGHHETGKKKPDFVTKSQTAGTDFLPQKERDTSTGNKVSEVESPVMKQEMNPAGKEEVAIKEKNDLNKNMEIGENQKTFSSTRKTWEIGVSISAVKAYIGDGIQLGLDPDKSNIAYDPENSFNSSAVRPGTNVDQTSIGPASSPENSYGFNAGITLKKKISSKTSFATGLGYTYYTNSILIGNQLSAGNYNSAGILSSYRNNFHFVNLPLSVQFHLNKDNKVPLDFSLGVNVSQLVTSNAVQYKSGFYEVDNSTFTKTQFGFQAGFYATLFRKLSVGPFYQYGLNPLAKEGLYGKKHLNFLGLKAELIFRKNK